MSESIQIKPSRAAEQRCAVEALLPALRDTLYAFTGSDPTIEELQGLADIIEIGSLKLTESTEPETVQSVMKAREKFFGTILGWDDPEHPLAKSYLDFKNMNPRVIPISTFIEAQSWMFSVGLDGVKIVNALPAAISLAPEGVRAKMDNFAALGLDGVKIVNALPAAISYSPEGVHTKVAALVETGLIQNGSDIPLHSDTAIAEFFILPIESLLLYVAETPQDTIDISTIASDARKHALKMLGATNALQRRQEYLARLPAVYGTLGGVAINHANYMKLPKGFTLLGVQQAA